MLESSADDGTRPERAPTTGTRLTRGGRRRGARRGLLRACGVLTATLLSATTFAAPVVAEDESGCTPGVNGCLPTREQCETGQYEGRTDGGTRSRFALCLTAPDVDGDGRREVLVYAAGSVSPGDPLASICGTATLADTSTSTTDPNGCEALTAAGTTLRGRLAAIGLDSCRGGEWTYRGRSVPFERCVGQFTSHDGTELDAGVTFPAGATGPLPAVLLLHGAGGDRRGSMDRDEVSKPWSRVPFVAKGYAAVTTTARGYWASCGQFDALHDDRAAGGPATLDAADEALAAGGDPCAEGWSHVAERDWEGRDSTYLLGLLVDAGVADERRLVATGESYGAGQTWLLATERPWTTPAGRGPVQLAGAVPRGGWTDLLDALIPNGRATDDRDQTASHERPFGIPKLTASASLPVSGLAPVPATDDLVSPPLTARLNHTKPEETHSYVDGWLAVVAAGEPYAHDAASDMAAAFRGKSAYHDTAGYLEALRARTVDRVPVFSMQGWTDPLFPAVQSLQMYRKLKQAHPGYPVWLRFGDFGHVPAQATAQLDEIHAEAHAFIDAVLLGADPELAAGPPIASYRTDCPGSTVERVQAGTWDALTGRPWELRGHAALTTTSEVRDPLGEAASDPFVHLATREVHQVELPDRCATSGDGLRRTEWSWSVPQDTTLLGLPKLTARYALTGVDATLVARLWDVAPDGRRVLVDRGQRRVATLEGDPATGTFTLALNGNHWTFRTGHRLALEVAQTDVGLLRPDDLPSSATWSDVVLSIPTAPAAAKPTT